jgi:hypothetical protein
MAAERLSFSKRIGFSIALVVLLFGALELGARALYALRTPLLALVGRSPREVNDLAPYKMPDARHPGLWIHRPGFTMTYAELVEYKRSQGRFVSLESIEATAARHQIRPDDVVLHMNRQGFKGPELDTSRTRPRLVTIGDSCTAGTQLDYFTYSRSLERELARLGVPVEVVNGGVEGYDASDVLFRLDEFRALRPEITTLYIGWNALYRERYLEDASGAARYLHSVRLFERARDALAAWRDDSGRAAREAYERPKRPARQAMEVALLDGYRPSFLWQVERIVAGMREAGSRVVILTLPGLYALDRDPSARALASRQGLTVVDLERWARDTLQPPESHFVDSVHLDELAQREAGVWLAGALEPLLAEGTTP